MHIVGNEKLLQNLSTTINNEKMKPHNGLWRLWMAKLKKAIWLAKKGENEKKNIKEMSLFSSLLMGWVAYYSFSICKAAESGSHFHHQGASLCLSFNHRKHGKVIPKKITILLITFLSLFLSFSSDRKKQRTIFNVAHFRTG